MIRRVVRQLIQERIKNCSYFLAAASMMTQEQSCVCIATMTMP